MHHWYRYVRKSARRGSGSDLGKYRSDDRHRMSEAKEHPPANTMNRATGDVATSSQDAQRQMQGRPTAAQQAEGAEPSAKMTVKHQPTVSQQSQRPESSEKR
jgi:hypothetical protein